MTIQFSASRFGLRNRSDIEWKNLVTDYSGVGNGSTNNYTPFQNWRTYAKQYLIDNPTRVCGLIVPPGDYAQSGAYDETGPGGWPPYNNSPLFGIKRLVVVGYGASFTIHGAAVGSARAAIDTVAAGAWSVTLKDEELASYYEAGNIVMIAGLDIQGGWGYPPNSHNFEYRRIAAVDGAVITFDSPLTHSYRDDWPRYFEGNAFELGGFGAATICRTLPGWDVEQTIYGLRQIVNGQTYAFGRKMTLIDVVHPAYGYIIGASEEMRIINQTHTETNHEVDKLCTKAVLENYGPSNKNIQVQSSSIQELHVIGGSRSVNGTARNTYIQGGSRPSVSFGPTAYGVSDYIEVTDAEITTGIGGSFTMGNSLGDELTYEGDGLFRYSGSAAPQWFVPGAVGLILTGSPYYMHSPFRILSVTSETGEPWAAQLIQTTLTGESLPTVSGQTNTSLVRHPAPNITVSNCTGSPSALELSLAPANSPYGIITCRTYDGTVAANTMGTVFGRLAHIKVNVTKAYTGVQSNLTLTLGGQFGTWVINSDWTGSRHQTSRVNLKVTGERVLDASGVTGSQTGDNNLSSFSGNIWLPLNFGFGVYIGNGSSPVNISGEDPSVWPSVTVEVLTDQEIPAAA